VVLRRWYSSYCILWQVASKKTVETKRLHLRGEPSFAGRWRGWSKRPANMGHSRLSCVSFHPSQTILPVYWARHNCVKCPQTVMCARIRSTDRQEVCYQSLGICYLHAWLLMTPVCRWFFTTCYDYIVGPLLRLHVSVGNFVHKCYKSLQWKFALFWFTSFICILGASPLISNFNFS